MAGNKKQAEKIVAEMLFVAASNSASKFATADSCWS